MEFRCSKLYPILDAQVLHNQDLCLGDVTQVLRSAGVNLVQYRDKKNGPQEILRAATQIAAIFEGTTATLILNDRADLALLAAWGVHVGQGDLLPQDARRMLGAHRVIGVSTHTAEQIIIADVSEADYIAIGPIFATSTKLDAEPVVGLAGLRRARSLTRKPLVAIGGITRQNARSVIDAGADSIAVIGGLFIPGESLEKVTRDFLEVLR